MSQPLKIFMKESICPPTDVCVCSYLCSITALIDCSIIQILRPIKKKNHSNFAVLSCTSVLVKDNYGYCAYSSFDPKDTEKEF